LKLRNILAAAAAATCLAAAPMAANATLTLTVDDLSTVGVDVTIVDPGAGPAIHVGPVGTWAINGTIGIGNGFSSIFGIDLNSLSISSSGGGTLRLSLTETDLSLGLPGPVGFSSLIGGTTGLCFVRIVG
jgi:ABC-type transport system substrate-binding protein